MVLAYHYITLRDGWGGDPTAFSPVVYHLSEYGWLGVEVFFLISGFVICMSAWGRSLGDFVTSRVSRLYPAYWVAVLLTAAVLTVWPNVRSADNWETVLTNLTMLQQGLGVPDVDDAYWTLFIELKFYLLFAIVVFRGVTYRRCVLFCGLWTVAGVVALKSNSDLLSVWAIAPYSPYFIAGIAFYLMHRFRPTVLLWAIVAISFLLAQHYLRGRLVMNLGAKADLAQGWPVRLAVLLAFALMAAIALGGSTNSSGAGCPPPDRSRIRSICSTCTSVSPSSTCCAAGCPRPCCCRGSSYSCWPFPGWCTDTWNGRWAGKSGLPCRRAWRKCASTRGGKCPARCRRNNGKSSGRSGNRIRNCCTEDRDGRRGPWETLAPSAPCAVSPPLIAR